MINEKRNTKMHYNRIQLVLVLLSLFLMLFSMGVYGQSSTPTSSSGIKVKIDEDHPELWEFYMNNLGGFCAVEAVEEDGGFFGNRDESAVFQGTAGGIVKHTGFNSLSNAVPCSGGDPCAVVRFSWRDSIDKNKGDKSLSTSNSAYRPRGDLLCGFDGRWYLCDFGFSGKIFQSGEGRDKSYRCTTGNDWVGAADCSVVQCDSGYVCDASSGVAQCVVECTAPKLSEGKLGEIKYVQCQAMEYLFDGTGWQKCEGNFWKKEVAGREYLCMGRGKGSIVECCGDTVNDCKSSNEAGKRLTTGQSVKPSIYVNEQVPTRTTNTPTSNNNPPNSNNPPASSSGGGENPNDNNNRFSGDGANARVVYSITSITGNVVAGDENANTYYCRADNRLVTDLDTLNAQSTCEKAGLKWTGTKCCSEEDDKKCTSQFFTSSCPAEFNGCMLQDTQDCSEKTESYNDPKTTNAIGGCWNSSFVRSIEFVNGTNFSVLNFGGEFNGCKIGLKQPDVRSRILEKKDYHTGVILVKDRDACFNDPDKRYFCSYRGWWNQTFGQDRTRLSHAPSANVPIEAECCGASQCWNGSICVDDQIKDPLAKPAPNTNLRCINGNWVDLSLKLTPDGDKSGYCPSEDMCLLNPQAANPKEQCMGPGNYTLDNYCEKGNWSSRTKQLALKLLELKSNDFVLFCDNRENTLNTLQEVTSSGSVPSNILTNLQTNNFCILKSGTRIIIATSINRDIEQVPSTSLSIFGVTSCSGALVDDGIYHSCDSSGKVWYNKRLRSLIYSQTPIQVQGATGTLGSFISSLLKNILDSVRRLITPPIDLSYWDTYVKGIRKFDRLYLAQQGTQSISASIEGKSPNIKNVVFEYKGLPFDICSFIQEYAQAKNFMSSGISCKKEGNNYYVLAQGSQFTDLDPESIWQDLTSKMRLR